MNRFHAWMMVALCGAINAHAGVSAPASLADLAQKADLIVIGSASGGSQSGEVFAFGIKVERVVKGDPGLTRTLLSAAWTAPTDVAQMMSSSQFIASGHGLWFLRNSPGDWRVLPRMGGWTTFENTFFPLPPGPISATYAYSSDAAV